MAMMMRLVQIKGDAGRRVAVVDEPRLTLVADFDSVYALASAAIERGVGLSALVGQHLSDHTLEYDAVEKGESGWRLMLPIDHPDGPQRLLVTGTGLTHLGSARNRQAMHDQSASSANELTDSMKMFRWGVEAGRPAPGHIGIAPEWFYKGNGSVLRASGEALDVPSHAEDGGEEAEIAGVYLIGPDAVPRRIGMTPGNEFSDHLFEKRNYLNLAGSKLRTCAIGPELSIDAKFDSIAGEVRIERGRETIWSKAIGTGESEMCHSLQNIEHHHFKFDGHRRPGDLHVHYYGAPSLSFGDGVRLADGDVMAIRWDNFGRPLRNRLHVASKSSDRLVGVIPLM
jgi:hypothetical protein